MEAYDAYRIYHALKLHFTTNYDYSKYSGKAKLLKKLATQIGLTKV